ncbi:MAG TPA: isocitrate/isopropylmalate family dehydrogenase [Hyphomicrobiaceae bacterium]|nr:isocitrate/isopropylmalate family dehydrogenase [Hyphomicrobiaceae bacterium]
MNILVLAGDGIGPEITEATLTLLRAVDRRFNLGLAFDHMEIGWAAHRRTGSTLPATVLEAARRAAGTILGPISHLDYPPAEHGGINVSAAFRKELDLFANIRPARTRRGVPHVGRAMDLVIVRENTEGFYADRNMAVGSGEFMPEPGMALAIRKVTGRACRRIAQSAFDLARRRRQKVTAVHKANVLRISEALFLAEVRHVAANYPDVAFEEVLIDAMAALLVREPSRFDVVVTTNMFGDILSDEASELAGGLGLAGSLNAGSEYAVAQAQHGSAPDIAGKDQANPVSLMLSAAMLLDWLADRQDRRDLAEAAGAIETTVDQLLADPARRTADLGGPLGTAAFASAAAAAVLAGGTAVT